MSYERRTPREVYFNPPLLESVFEVRFEPSEPDWLLPGTFYQRIRDLLPEVLPLGNPALPGNPLRDALPIIPLIRYSNSEQTLFCQLGPGGFTVHAARPYLGFDVLASKCSALLQELFACTPNSVIRRLGMRNINELPLDFAVNDLNDWVNFAPLVPDQMRLWPLTQFQLSTISEVPGTDCQARTLVRVQESSIVLDVDCFEGFERPPEITWVASWLETAHDIVADIFHASMTEQARIRFRSKPA